MNKFESTDAKLLSEAMTRVLDLMADVDPGSEEYEKLMSDLERLSKVRTSERPTKLSRDTMALVAGNVFIALVVVIAEKSHSMTSKGLGFMMKPKFQN